MRDIRLAPILVVLMAVFFLVSGAWTVWSSLGTPLQEAWRIRAWLATPAVLDEFALLAADGSKIPVPSGFNVTPQQREAVMPSGVVRLFVRYHYDFGDEVYASTRFGIHSELDDGDVLRRTAAHLYQKQQITVWVNPDNPTEALMDRSVHWTGMLVSIPALVLLITGWVILDKTVRTLWHMHQTDRWRQNRRRILSSREESNHGSPP